MRRLSEIAVCFLSFPLFFGSRERSELQNTRAKMLPDDKENRVATETDSLGNFFGVVFAQNNQQSDSIGSDDSARSMAIHC